MLNLYQRELAGLLGVSRKTVTNWSRGHTHIPGSVAQLINAWLHDRSLVDLARQAKP
jgi:DNA-binding transcriptional regulator YiaG